MNSRPAARNPEVEKYQYIGDDTALNGIRIYCERKDGTSDSTFEEGIGLDATSRTRDGRISPKNSRWNFSPNHSFLSWGEWESIHWCLRGFIVAFTLRIEEYKTVGDNTAANNINVMCSEGEYLEGEGMIWGSYGAWSNRCHNGICGIQTRVQENQGLLADDTALNDVRFLCC
ncbi:Hypothetical predicted protein [Pelobates cultripes]|uniref:Vitelline membrane outer layer 1-like protein n=1 Tax=Pelobates cultripes TaxID=61616 RepID=A0AAD1VXM4_PELCU|nr:Hypothetical predicted protein [Pelobates cultripes]